MTLAIEPMITASGETDVQLDEDDGWSIYSADHSLTAHYEHTVAVTDDGPLVLTRHEGWSPVDDEVGATPLETGCPGAGFCYHAASRFAAACPLGQTQRARSIVAAERES